MKKRVLCLLLGLLLLLSGCVAVNDGGGSNDTAATTDGEGTSAPETSAPTETEPAEVIEYFDLVKGGVAQYIVICENGDALASAEDFREAIQQKTSTPFTFRRYVKPDDTLKKIYIGGKYNDIMSPETPKLYGTYGVFAKDGDIYICADTVAGLGQCVAEFLASITPAMITKDADGKTELILSSELFFLFEPTPSAVTGILLGVPVSEYTIVIPAQATEAEKYYASKLQTTIQDKTLITVPIITDQAPAAEREIIIGNTKRPGNSAFYGSTPDPYSYALKSKDDDLYIGYGNVYGLGEAVFRFNSALVGMQETVDIRGNLKTEKHFLDRDSEDDVRIITSNVLYVGYDTSDGAKDIYKARMELTAEYYNLVKADFIGAQECNSQMRNAITPHLDSCYKWVTIETNNTNTDYFPILYNADEWTVVASGAVERTVSQTERPWGYVWATFARKSDPNEKYTLANLHYVPLSFVERGVSWAEYRVPLAENLNAFIKAQLASNPNVPVFVTGDYNGKPGSDVYEAQIAGIAMNSTYKLATDSNSGDCIDNICVTTELVDVLHHKMAIDSNRGFMSDHAYHFADVKKK